MVYEISLTLLPYEKRKVKDELLYYAEFEDYSEAIDWIATLETGTIPHMIGVKDTDKDLGDQEINRSEDDLLSLADEITFFTETHPDE